MRENSGDVETTGALNIHEEGVGGLNESFQFVLAFLGRGRRVKKIDRHFDYNTTTQKSKQRVIRSGLINGKIR